MEGNKGTSPVAPPARSAVDPPPTGEENEVPISDDDHEETKHPYPVPFPTQPRAKFKFDPSKYTGVTCETVFRLWFEDQIPVRYYNLMQDGPVSKTSRNAFSILKKTVHAMLKELEDYPDLETDLHDLAAKAMRRMQVTLGIPMEDIKYKRIGTTWTKTQDRKRVTMSSLFEQGRYAEKSFPASTPQSIIAFFGNSGNNPNASRKRARAEEPPT